MKKAGKIHIGASGWSYKHWKGPFYPKDISDRDMLPFYFGFFDTVEINSSFYHLPLRRTFENWNRSSPEGFIYSVKGSRYITHVKKLKDSTEAVERFFERASGLAQKTGPVLFQLPPNLKLNLDRLEEFLSVLPSGHRSVFEFRNPSWFDYEVYSLLSRNGSAFCIYELAGKASPVEVTADFVYIRLHGPAGPYQGSYDKEALSLWAKRLKKWVEEGLDVFCYFDNDEKAYAPLNAIELRKMIGGNFNAAQAA